jgi:hypothetical protein
MVQVARYVSVLARHVIKACDVVLAKWAVVKVVQRVHGIALLAAAWLVAAIHLRQQAVTEAGLVGALARSHCEPA